jgi:hypothetical protein
MKNFSFLLVVTLLAASCASHKDVEKDLEQKAAQSNVKDPKALGGTIENLIQNSNFKPEVKAELEKILAANKQKAMELSEKSYEFRAVLIEELLSGKANLKKVDILKKDIKRIEDAKLKNTLDAVEKISSIVSESPNKDKFAPHLLNMDRR